MSTPTVAARLSALEASIAALVSTLAPATSAPAKGEAKSPAFGDKTFTEYVASRNAAKLACVLHPASACTRTFSPKSSGNQNHEARIV